MWIACCLVALGYFGSKAMAAGNMNGGEKYLIANAENYNSTFTSEYFEVYSPPIKTRYSEVYWTLQDAVPLPDEIMRRFHNKIIAIVGYEVDQVRRTQEGDIPVPITHAYNHHYMAWINSHDVDGMIKVHASKEMKQRGMAHGREEVWVPNYKHREKGTNKTTKIPSLIKDAQDKIPRSQFFSEGNGGEFRKSYHGYPGGYAQLIFSPAVFRISPMQIDTWNRDQKDSPAYKPGGPIPKTALDRQGAGYNPLVECPCSDREVKHWAMAHDVQGIHQPCVDSVKNATECWNAIKTIIDSPAYRQHIGESSKVEGCTLEQHEDGTVDMYWKTPITSSDIGNLVKTSAVSCSKSRKGKVVGFASAEVNVTISLDNDQDLATVTLVAPSDKWFGVGFGTSSMCLQMEADECPTGGPYVVLVLGNEVQERKLDFHGPGMILEPSITIQNNSERNGSRTLVFTRPLQGDGESYFSFDIKQTSLEIITAQGCSLDFGQHCQHSPAQLIFLAMDTPTRVCQRGIEGEIGGNRFVNKGRCAPFPYSDLAAQNNPTCSIEEYRGGLVCCHHQHSLLDTDQAIPWADQYLEYHLKFRFYFQEYKERKAPLSESASHRNLNRIYWQTESYAGEYDIVPCKKDLPSSQCVQVITSRWKVRDSVDTSPYHQDDVTGVDLIYAGPHCHAPSCLSMELYDADTGRLLCRVEPSYGQSDDVYDEYGFLSLPPCLWGDESEGLSPPETLTMDQTLLSIKRNNNTFPHTGEMASWQMRGALVLKSEIDSFPNSRLFQSSLRRGGRYDADKVN